MSKLDFLLFAAHSDGRVVRLEPREQVAICLAVWLADAHLHPDRYRESAVDTVHNLLAMHVKQIGNLRSRYGLEQLPDDGTDHTLGASPE